MERQKKLRTVTRSSFTRAHAKFVSEQEVGNSGNIHIQANFLLLETKATELVDMDRKIVGFMVDADCSEAEIEQDVATSDEYQIKFATCKISISNIGIHQANYDHESMGGNIHSHKKKFKLPDIELKKFGGDVKDWLHFWGLFKKIDEDEDIDPEDKFQYLIQSTIQGTRARELVDSFPPTGGNYKKVIESLKSRFGRNDLLVEVYVRELLKLVLFNALNANEKMSLSSLYDKLESHLRALETLGVTTDNFAAMLYPLVESCLPEDLLRAWQRSSTSVSAVINPLTGLMSFLRSEVEREERILLAVHGFGLGHEQFKQKKRTPPLVSEEDVPTAAALFTAKTVSCAFCDGGHTTSDCFKAQTMNLSDKLKMLRAKRCCFTCLKSGHTSTKCKSQCRCVVCGRKHVVLMCPDLAVNKEAVKEVDEEMDNTVNIDSALANNTCSSEVFLQTLVVKLRGNGTDKLVRAIIDTGSQKSYILRESALQMCYQSQREERIIHSLFGGIHSNEYTHLCYKIHLGSLDGKYLCNFDALDQPVICGKISHIKNGPWIQELRNKSIELTDVGRLLDHVEVLIGADVAGKLMTGRHYKLKCGLVAIETLLGWTLMGKVPWERQSNQTTMLVTSMFVKDADISDLWNLDVIGIAHPTDRKSKEERERATKEHFMKTVKINEDERYEIRLPWIEGCPPLPTNRDIAEKRLVSTTKKLHLDNRFDEYSQVFDTWLADGIIEEVPTTDLESYGHYLPHRHVIKESSNTTKIRPVFDASARHKNFHSLNQCLETGPNLIELIPSILLRFREKKIGVISDIKKAFLQISVCPEDRNFLRFLWWDKTDKNKIREFRHKRVVFGVTSSPFLLGAVIEHHLQRALREIDENQIMYSHDTVLRLMKSYYVDNCVTSVNSEQQLNKFICESQAIMLYGGFDLRGWEYTMLCDVVKSELTPVLGLKWDRNCDTLQINLDYLKDLQFGAVTKRSILSLAHRIYDPIGFTCPTVLCPKLLLQETWACKIGWDTEVNDEMKNRFLKWAKDLTRLGEIHIPRLLPGKSYDTKHWSLHVFCDASRLAYATAVFLRTETTESRTIHVQLVQSKSRVAPVKELTIPRLELLAATVGARLATSVQEDFDCHDIPLTFWTDSTTVLSWIQREDQWGTFVWNRVQEIRKLTNPDDWRHVPGNMNPADLPSRGCSVRRLLESKWWEGPNWLKTSPCDWPMSNSTLNELEINQEKRKNAAASMTCTTIDTISMINTDWYYKYFSRYTKVIRLVGWIMRFVRNCRCKSNKRVGGELTVVEIENAENKVIKFIQQASFINEKDKKIAPLRAYKDSDNILRLNTKITCRADTENYRSPVILPAHHPVVQLLIREWHEKMMHAGVHILLNALREKFWILRGRRTIRSVVYKCTICRRQEANRLESLPGPLPEERVKEARVFESTGVDFAGPVFLKGGTKAWICLFTCAVFRAVHLELVTSLSTEAFLQVLRRFVARRGRPNVIFSDNATNFVGSDNAFSKLDWARILEESTIQRIKWKFNPPTAAWWGGWWERLVRLMKQLLKKTLGRATLTYQEMITVLCDCEAIINSRPLTYISHSDEDLVPLTPAMFLQDIQEIGIPDCDNIDATNLNKRLRYRQKLINDLRKRFRSEYLGQLVQRAKGKENQRTISVGDIVLIGSDNSKRVDWPLARVIEVIPGKDGVVRLFRLQTSHGVLLRPIQRIYPLEVSSKEYNLIDMSQNT